MKKLITLLLCVSLLDIQGLTLGYTETQNPSQSTELNSTLLSSWFEITSQSKTFSWSNPGIILIRDLHADGEAQLKIAKGLEAMTRQTGSTLVLEEGAVGKIDTGFLGTFPNQSIREEITKEYVKSGWVRGPEFLSIARFGELDLELRGVEDQNLYQENFAQYREVMKHKEEIETGCILLKKELIKAKKKFCSVEFRKFEEKREQFQDNQIAFDEYVKFLLHYSFSPFQHPHLSLFSDLMKKKSHINEVSAEKEKNRLVEELSQKLDKDSLGSFIRASLEYRFGRMSAQEFNQYLSWQAEKIGKNIKNYPELYKLIEWIKIQGEVDGVKLLEEIKSLEEVNINKLAKTTQEKKLKDLTRQIQAIQSFLSLELSRQDWEKYLKNTKGYDALKISQELGSILGEKPILGLEKINGILVKARKFYELARARDQIIAQNSIRSMKEVSRQRPARTTILVVGGFHATGVQEILNAQGVNYIELTPKMNHIPNASLYLTRMMDPRFKIGTIPLPCLFQEVVQALAVTVSQDAQKKIGILYINALKGRLLLELKGDTAGVQKRLLEALGLWEKQRGELSDGDKKIFKILEEEIKNPSSTESAASDISKDEIRRWMEGKEYTELHANVLIKILETFYSERKDLIEYAKDLYQKKWGRHKVRRQIFIHQDGMAMAPVLTALNKMEVFKLFEDGRSVSMGEIIRTTKGSPGYLHVAMRLFVSQGWMTRKGEEGTDNLTYTLTEDGTYILSLLDYYGPVAEFIDQAVGIDDYLFGKSRAPPADGQKKSYAQLIELSKNQWNLPPETDSRKKMLRERVIQQLNGMLLGPTMVALGMRGVFDQFNPETHSVTINQIQGNAKHLKEAFTLLEQQGWLTRNGDVFTLTHDGRSAAVLASAYGVTTSYLPLFSKLKELLKGQSREALFPRDKNNNETHVNRPMNVWASGGAHIAYFKEADKMIIEIFNRPLEEQPRGIADMGCGDGAFLIHLHEIVMRTKRGEKIKETLTKILELEREPALIKDGGAKHQEYLLAKAEYEKYKLVIVGADFNKEPRIITQGNLEKAGIKDAKIIFGNINDPKKYAEDLRALGLDPKSLLHVRSMLDHNRPYVTPKNTDHIRADRKADSGSYVNDGQVIPNNQLQQNLVEHLEGWQEHCVGDAGLLVIELHTIPPELAATKIGDTLATPYDAHHGFSDQYIAEIPTFVGAATEAGLELVEQKAFPTTTPEAATVSINYFRASAKKKVQVSWARSFGKVYAVHDGPDGIYQALRSEITKKDPQFNFDLLEKAYRFGAEKYRDIRHDGRPYIVHPLEIALYLVRVLGIVDQDAILAAILHDLVEDENVLLNEIKEMFGENVRALVDDLSEDSSYLEEQDKVYKAQNGQELTGKLAMKIEHIERVDKKSGKLCIIIKIVNRLHNLLSNEYPVRKANYGMNLLEIQRWRVFLDHHVSDIPPPLMEDIRYFLGRNKKSPDLTPEGAEITVTHDERNAPLGKRIKDSEVTELSIDEDGSLKAALVIHDSNKSESERIRDSRKWKVEDVKKAGTKLLSARNKLMQTLEARLANPESSLAKTYQYLIAAGKIENQEAFKNLLLEKAKQMSLLVVGDEQDLLSAVIHQDGPYMHCRRGVSGRPPALWMGYITLKRMSEEMLTRALLDEALHVAFPEEEHRDKKGNGTLLHDQELYEHCDQILRFANIDYIYQKMYQAQQGIIGNLEILRMDIDTISEEDILALKKIADEHPSDRISLDSREEIERCIGISRRFFDEARRIVQKLPSYLEDDVQEIAEEIRDAIRISSEEMNKNLDLAYRQWLEHRFFENPGESQPITPPAAFCQFDAAPNSLDAIMTEIRKAYGKNRFDEVLRLGSSLADAIQKGLAIPDDVHVMIGKGFLDRARRMKTQGKIENAIRDFDRAIESFVTMRDKGAVKVGEASVEKPVLIEEVSREIVVYAEGYVEKEKENSREIPLEVHFALGRAYLWSAICEKSEGNIAKAMQHCARAMDFLTHYAAATQTPVVRGAALLGARKAPTQGFNDNAMLYLSQAMIENGIIQMFAGSYDAARQIFQQTLTSNTRLGEKKAELQKFVQICKDFISVDKEIVQFSGSKDADASSLLGKLADLESRTRNNEDLPCAAAQIFLYRWMIYWKLKDASQAETNFQKALESRDDRFLIAFRSLINAMSKAKVLWNRDFLQAIAAKKGQPFLRRFLREIVKDYYRSLDLKEFREAVMEVLGFKSFREYVEWLLQEEQERAVVGVAPKKADVGSPINHPGLVAPLIEAIQVLPSDDERKVLAARPDISATPVLQAALRGEIRPIADVIRISLELRDELEKIQKIDVEVGDQIEIRQKCIDIAKKFKDVWLFTESDLVSAFWDKFFTVFSGEMNPDIEEALKIGLAWIERHSHKSHEHQRSYMYYQCGQIYYMTNLRAEATACFQKVIEQSSSAELKIRSYFSLGSLLYLEVRDLEDGAEKTSKLKQAKDLVARTLTQEALKIGAIDASVGHMMLSYICAELCEYKEAYEHLMNAKTYPGNFLYAKRKFLKSFGERFESLTSGEDLKVYKDFLVFACKQENQELRDQLIRFRSVKNRAWVRAVMEVLSNKGIALKQREAAIAFLRGMDLETESAGLIGILREQAGFALKQQPHFLWEGLELLRTCPTPEAKAFIQEILDNGNYAKAAGYRVEKINTIAKARDQYESLPDVFEVSDERAKTSKYCLTRKEWSQMLLDYWPSDSEWDEYVLERESSKLSDKFERLSVHEIRKQIEKAREEGLAYDAIIGQLEALNVSRINVNEELKNSQIRLARAQKLMDEGNFSEAAVMLYEILTGRSRVRVVGLEMIIAHERNGEDKDVFVVVLKAWELLERANYFMETRPGDSMPTLEYAKALIEKWKDKDEELRTKDPVDIMEVVRALYFLERPQDALRVLELIPPVFFDNYGYFALWRLRLMFKTDDDRFLGEYERVKEMTDPKAKNLLGKFCRERGLFSESMEAFQDAYTGADFKLTNTNETRPGAFIDAVQAAQVPIREVFEDAFLSCFDMMLGSSLRNKGADFVRVHLHENAFADMILMSAEMLYEAGCYLEALNLLNQRLNQIKEKKHLIEYHQCRGKILAALNRDDEALKAYEEAVKIDASKFEHWRDLIGIYYEKKDRSNTIRCIKRAMSVGASAETSYCVEDILKRVLGGEDDSKLWLADLLSDHSIASPVEGIVFGGEGEERNVQFTALEAQVEKVFGAKINFVFSENDIKTKNISDEIFNKIKTATKTKSPYLEEVLGEGMFNAMVQEAMRADCLGEILNLLFSEAASNITVSKGKGVAKAGRRNETLKVDGPIINAKLINMGVQVIQRLKIQGDTSLLEKIAKGPWVAETPEFQKALKGEVVRVSTAALTPDAQGPPSPGKDPDATASEVSGDEDAAILAALKECIQAYSSNQTLLAFQKALELAPRFKNLSNNPTKNPKDLETFAGEAAVLIDILSKYGDIRFDASLEEGLKAVLDWTVRAGPAFKILRVLAVHYRGKLYLKAQQFAKSRAFFATALALDPSEVKNVLPDIAEAYFQEMRMSSDVNQRRKLAQEAIPVIENDSSCNSLIALGWFYAEVGSYDKVFGVIKKLNAQRAVLAKGGKDQEKVDVDLIFRSMMARCFETLREKDIETQVRFIQVLISNQLESAFAETLERGKEQGPLWTQALIIVLNQEMSSTEKDRLIQLLKGADFRGAEEQWLEILRQKADLSDAKKKEAFFKFAIPVSARCFSLEVRDFLQTLKPGFSSSKDTTLAQAIDQAVASIEGNQAIETKISEGTSYLTLKEWQASLRRELPLAGEWDEWMLEVETAKFLEEFPWMKARKIRDELVKARQSKLDIEAVRFNLKTLEEEIQRQFFKDKNLSQLESIEQEIHKLVENGQWDEAFGYITLAREGNAKKGFPGYYQLWRNASGEEKDKYLKKLQEIRDFAEHWFFLWRFESDLKEAAKGQKGSAIDIAYERMVKPYIDTPSKLALKAPVDLGEIATCFYVVGAKRKDTALQDKAREILESINLQEVLKTDSVNIHRVVSAFKNILGYERAKAVLDMIDLAIIKKDQRLRGLYLLVFSRLNAEDAFVVEADSFERDFPDHAPHYLGLTYEARENQEKSLAYYDRAFQEAQIHGWSEKYLREHSLWLRPAGMASVEYRIRRLRGLVTDSEYHWVELIDVLSSSGRYLESMRLAKEKMRSVSPKNQIELQCHIGACYENMERREEAFTAYEAARLKSTANVETWDRIQVFCVSSFLVRHPKAGEWIKHFYNEAIKTRNTGIIDSFKNYFRKHGHPLDVNASGDITIRFLALEKIVKEACDLEITIQMPLNIACSSVVDREIGKIVIPHLKEKFPNLVGFIGDEIISGPHFDLEGKSPDFLLGLEEKLSKKETNIADAIEAGTSIISSGLVKDVKALVNSLWTRVQAGDAQAKIWLGALAQVEGVTGDFGDISIELEDGNKIIRFKKMEEDLQRDHGVHVDLVVRVSEFKDYDPRAVLDEIEGRMSADIEARLESSSNVTRALFEKWKSALVSGSLKDAGVLIRPLWKRVKAADAQARQWLADLVGLEQGRGDFGEIRIELGAKGNELCLNQVGADLIEEKLLRDDSRDEMLAGLQNALTFGLVSNPAILINSLWAKVVSGNPQAALALGRVVETVADVDGEYGTLRIETREGGVKVLHRRDFEDQFEQAFGERMPFVLTPAELKESGLKDVRAEITAYVQRKLLEKSDGETRTKVLSGLKTFFDLGLVSTETLIESFWTGAVSGDAQARESLCDVAQMDGVVGPFGKLNIQARDDGRKTFRFIEIEENFESTFSSKSNLSVSIEEFKKTGFDTVEERIAGCVLEIFKTAGQKDKDVIAGIDLALEAGLIRNAGAIMRTLLVEVKMGNDRARKWLCDVARLERAKGDFGEISIESDTRGKVLRFKEMQRLFRNAFEEGISFVEPIDQFEKEGLALIQKRIVGFVEKKMAQSDEMRGKMLKGFEAAVASGLVSDAGILVRSLYERVLKGESEGRVFLTELAAREKVLGDFGDIAIEKVDEQIVIRFRMTLGESTEFTASPEEFGQLNLPKAKEAITQSFESDLMNEDRGVREAAITRFKQTPIFSLLAENLVRSIWGKVLQGNASARRALCVLARDAGVRGDFEVIEILDSPALGVKLRLKDMESKFNEIVGKSVTFMMDVVEFEGTGLSRIQAQIISGLERGLLSDDEPIRAAAFAGFKKALEFGLVTDASILAKPLWEKAAKGDASARNDLCDFIAAGHLKGNFEGFSVVEDGRAVRLSAAEKELGEAFQGINLTISIEEFRASGLAGIQSKIIQYVIEKLESVDEAEQDKGIVALQKALQTHILPDARAIVSQLWKKVEAENVQARTALVKLLLNVEGDFEEVGIETVGEKKVLHLKEEERKYQEIFGEKINILVPVSRFLSIGLDSTAQSIIQYTETRLSVADENARTRIFAKFKNAIDQGLIKNANDLVGALLDRVISGKEEDKWARVALSRFLSLNWAETEFDGIVIEKRSKGKGSDEEKVIHFLRIENESKKNFSLGKKDILSITLVELETQGSEGILNKIMGFIKSERKYLLEILDEVKLRELLREGLENRDMEDLVVDLSYFAAKKLRETRITYLPLNSIRELLKDQKCERKDLTQVLEMLQSLRRLAGGGSVSFKKVEEETQDVLVITLPASVPRETMKQYLDREDVKGRLDPVILGYANECESKKAPIYRVILSDGSLVDSGIVDRGTLKSKQILKRLPQRGYASLEKIEGEKGGVLVFNLSDLISKETIKQYFEEQRVKSYLKFIIERYVDEYGFEKAPSYQVLLSDGSQIDDEGVKEEIEVIIKAIINERKRMAEEAAASKNGETAIDGNGLNGGAGTNGANGANDGITHVEAGSVGVEVVIGTETGASETETGDGRGFSSLQKEIYNRPVREGLKSGGWVGATFDREKVTTVSRIANDSGGEDFNSTQTLNANDQKTLTQVIESLSEEDRAHLQGLEELGGKVTVVFIDGLDEAVKAELREKGKTVPSDCYGSHYGLSRPQIYLDRNLLKDPIQLRIHLHHELAEREAVIRALVSPGYPDWRKNRTDPNVVKIIHTMTHQKHNELLLEERRMPSSPAYGKENAEVEALLHQLDHSKNIFWMYLKNDAKARQIMRERLYKLLIQGHLRERIKSRLSSQGLQSITVTMGGASLWRSEKDTTLDVDISILTDGDVKDQGIWRSDDFLDIDFSILGREAIRRKTETRFLGLLELTSLTIIGDAGSRDYSVEDLAEVAELFMRKGDSASSLGDTEKQGKKYLMAYVLLHHFLSEKVRRKVSDWIFDGIPFETYFLKYFKGEISHLPWGLEVSDREDRFSEVSGILYRELSILRTNAIFSQLRDILKSDGTEFIEALDKKLVDILNHDYAHLDERTRDRLISGVLKKIYESKHPLVISQEFERLLRKEGFSEFGIAGLEALAGTKFFIQIMHQVGEGRGWYEDSQMHRQFIEIYMRSLLKAQGVDMPSGSANKLIAYALAKLTNDSASSLPNESFDAFLRRKGLEFLSDPCTTSDQRSQRLRQLAERIAVLCPDAETPMISKLVQSELARMLPPARVSSISRTPREAAFAQAA